ncbi:50S ribosomal protein L4 [Candidatus Woesearchaeota archaeon]|nr:50S ribosomal protein L4 [Candidatus Woesearchaeota archaeon]
MNFPDQFQEPVRKDLIIRAVLAIRSIRKPYGASPRAGKEKSAKLSRRRRDYKGAYGKGISRSSRKTMSRRGTQMTWMGALSPHTRGGMRAHPPKAEKIWLQKINDKERKKAIRSALAATIQKEYVTQRGHKLPKEYPIILENDFEKITKTKDVIKKLESLGLQEELSRCSITTIKAGRAKTRERKHKRKKGPLLVVSKDCPVIKAARSIQGIDITPVNILNAELLAPGTHPGRLTLYTQEALKTMQEKRMFI